MYDYWKIYIPDKTDIDKILQNPKIEKMLVSKYEDAELIAIRGKYRNWNIQTLLHPYRLEITGSIHKYWNKGTNENDFTIKEAKKAIKAFCNDFNITPSKANLINLEFGVNLVPSVLASEIIDQILCFNYSLPIRPYEKTPNCYFIEFEQHDYYLKVYDKGKQYRSQIPGLGNVLRLEIKGMNRRFLQRMGIYTLADLLQVDKMQVLGMKTVQLLQGLIFEDDSINPSQLNKKDKLLYKQLAGKPKVWQRMKGKSTTSQRRTVKRFKELIDQQGKRHIYTLLNGLVSEKVQQLTGKRKWSFFIPNYTLKTNQNRFCLSCGNDISRQHPKSKYCSPKYVGEVHAHKCRNMNSNPRNNRKRKIEAINRKGVLFDVGPYVIEGGKGKKRALCQNNVF